jgi:hypothetical protein
MIELQVKKHWRKYEVNKNAFLNEDAVSFYLLGAFMTDGNVNCSKHHINCSISSKDSDWLDSIRDQICPQKPVYYKSFSFQFSETECQNWLMSYGCLPNKSLTLKIEKDIPLEYQRDFLRGVVDGDGSISESLYTKTSTNGTVHTYTKKSLYICSASLEFIKQLILMIPSDINFSFIKVKQSTSYIEGRKITPSNENFYRISFSDSNAVKFAKYIYYDGHELSLNRKKEKAQKWFL